MMITRAALAATLVLCLFAAPFAAEAQQAGKTYRIGVLDTTPVTLNGANLDAFRQGLRALGYVKGKSFVIEYRWAGAADQFPDLARERVRSKVDLILTRGQAAITAAKNATRTIPIVMAGSGDPLGTGVVTGLARPGGNVTGLSTFVVEVSGKRVQLLKDAIPGIRRIAAVNSKDRLGGQRWRAIEQSARSMGLEPHLVEIAKAEDLGPAFDAAIKHRADAVVVGLGPVIQNNVARVVDLAKKHRLPAVFVSRELVDAGGLVAYGVNYPDLYRRAATYVDKIFKVRNRATCPSSSRRSSSS